MGRPLKFTKAELMDALSASGSDPIRAAVALAVSPSTVYRAMDRYGIQVETEKRIKPVAA